MVPVTDILYYITLLDINNDISVHKFSFSGVAGSSKGSLIGVEK